MHPQTVFLALVAITSTVSAVTPTRRHNQLRERQASDINIAGPAPAFTAPGVATFNNFVQQGITVCGPTAGANGAFGAAAGDISPDVSRGTCTVNPADPTPSTANCEPGTQSDIPTYIAPSCPQSYCGPTPQCYNVTNQGSIGGAPGSPGTLGSGTNSVTVQIIDVCPFEHAQNFCKTQTPANERCGDPSTNSLDIDTSAYEALTGAPYANVSLAPDFPLIYLPSSARS